MGEKAGGKRGVTGGERPAQPGLKATLKALGGRGYCTLLAIREEMRGPLRRCSSLWRDFSVAAQLLTFCQSCRSGLHQDPICSLSVESAMGRKLIQQFCCPKRANSALLRARVWEEYRVCVRVHVAHHHSHFSSLPWVAGKHVESGSTLLGSVD